MFIFLIFLGVIYAGLNLVAGIVLAVEGADLLGDIFTFSDSEYRFILRIGQVVLFLLFPVVLIIGLGKLLKIGLGWCGDNFLHLPVVALKHKKEEEELHKTPEWAEEEDTTEELDR